MDTLNDYRAIPRAKVPMAFIGGPLNLRSIPKELLDNLQDYEAMIPDTLNRIRYICTVWRLPSKPNTDFVFYFDTSSMSLEQAADTIKTNFFKQ